MDSNSEQLSESLESFYLIDLTHVGLPPMYILDQVDSALDMSHTQNIGLVIRKSFRNAQIIIVSLKDGNANVLFNTKFVNGISTVGQAENVPSKKTKEK